MTPYSFSTRSWFVSLILEDSIVPLPSAGRRNRQPLWLGRLCFLGSCASMGSDTAHPSAQLPAQAGTLKCPFEVTCTLALRAEIKGIHLPFSQDA